MRVIITIFLFVSFFNSCSTSSKNEEKELLDISGTWSGLAYDMSDIPEEPNVPITFILDQSGEELTGSFQYWDNLDPIFDGTVIDSIITFSTGNSSPEIIYYLFQGTVFGDSIGGDWSVMNSITNEPYTTNPWYVIRGFAL